MSIPFPPSTVECTRVDCFYNKADCEECVMVNQTVCMDAMESLVRVVGEGDVPMFHATSV